MIFYCIDESSPCRAVILFMHALSLKPEIRPIDFSKNDHMAPEFLKMNPQHSIPLLIDDGFILSESRAILGYLAEKYAPGTVYYPNDPMARGVVNQRLLFDLGTLYQRLLDAYLLPFITGKDKVNEEERIKMIDALGYLETFMGNALYMAGDKMTIADYSIIATVSSIDKIGMDWTPYPKIKAWYDRCQMEMKDYSEANEKGAELLSNMIKGPLNLK